VGVSSRPSTVERKQDVELKIDQMRQLQQLREECGKLKKLVAELNLGADMLEGARRKIAKPLALSPSGAVPVRRVSGESAPCVPYRPRGYVGPSIRKHLGAEDGPSIADSGDRPGPGSTGYRKIQVGTAEVRGPESGKKLVYRLSLYPDSGRGRQMKSPRLLETHCACDKEQ
jgi:hypothetical protein